MTYIIYKAVTQSHFYKYWHPILAVAPPEKPMHFTCNWLPLFLCIATPYGMELLCIKGMNKVVLKGGLGTNIHPLCLVVHSLKTIC